MQIRGSSGSLLKLGLALEVFQTTGPAEREGAPQKERAAPAAKVLEAVPRKLLPDSASSKDLVEYTVLPGIPSDPAPEMSGLTDASSLAALIAESQEIRFAQNPRTLFEQYVRLVRGLSGAGKTPLTVSRYG